MSKENNDSQYEYMILLKVLMIHDGTDTGAQTEYEYLWREVTSCRK